MVVGGVGGVEGLKQRLEGGGVWAGDGDHVGVALGFEVAPLAPGLLHAGALPQGVGHELDCAVDLKFPGGRVALGHEQGAEHALGVAGDKGRRVAASPEGVEALFPGGDVLGDLGGEDGEVGDGGREQDGGVGTSRGVKPGGQVDGGMGQA